MVGSVNKWASTKKKEIIRPFLMDENYVPNFFPNSSVLFVPVYQQVIKVVSIILGNEDDLYVNKLMFSLMNDTIPRVDRK
jgi:hypothetical protein